MAANHAVSVITAPTYLGIQQSLAGATPSSTPAPPTSRQHETDGSTNAAVRPAGAMGSGGGPVLAPASASGSSSQDIHRVVLPRDRV
jgi:hypothetical protein